MKPLLIQYGVVDENQTAGKLAAMNDTTNEFAIKRSSKISEYIQNTSRMTFSSVSKSNNKLFKDTTSKLDALMHGRPSSVPLEDSKLETKRDSLISPEDEDYDVVQ